MYTAKGIPVGMGIVHFVDLIFGGAANINKYGEVTYSQDLMGCTFNHSTTPPTCDGNHNSKGKIYKYGRFAAATPNKGSMFIPVSDKFVEDPNAPTSLKLIDQIVDNSLIIQWCPKENHFKVFINTHIPFAAPAGPYFLRWAGGVAPADDAHSEL